MQQSLYVIFRITISKTFQEHWHSSPEKLIKIEKKDEGNNTQRATSHVSVLGIFFQHLPFARYYLYNCNESTQEGYYNENKI